MIPRCWLAVALPAETAACGSGTNGQSLMVVPVGAMVRSVAS